VHYRFSALIASARTQPMYYPLTWNIDMETLTADCGGRGRDMRGVRGR